MLFTLTKDNQAVFRPECIQLCQPLAVLNEKQRLYVILAYDYHSPYHQLPKEEWKRTARVHVYGSLDYDPEESTIVTSAVRAYVSLQYDPKRETIQVYITKVRYLERDLTREDSSTKINQILKSISLLQKSAEELQKEIDKDEDMLQLEGEGKLSFLEKMQNSRELYKIHHANIRPKDKAQKILSESSS